MTRVRLCGFTKYPLQQDRRLNKHTGSVDFGKSLRRPALSTTTFAMYIYTKTGPTSTPTTCVPLPSTLKDFVGIKFLALTLNIYET